MCCEGSVCPPLLQEYTGNSKPLFPVSNTTKLPHCWHHSSHPNCPPAHWQILSHFFLFILSLLMLYTSAFLFVEQEYSPQAQVQFCRNILSSFPKIPSHATLFWGFFSLTEKAVITEKAVHLLLEM